MEAPVKYHNIAVSCAKAVTIILMVAGHAGVPEWLNSFFVNFRMPLFFFASGYVLSPKYFSKKTEYIKRRTRALWWPYVKWALIFLLLHNVFASMCFYDDTYSAAETLKRVGMALAMVQKENLLGGFWFLNSLFFASIISCFLLWGIYRSRRPSVVMPLVLLGMIILSSVFVYISPRAIVKFNSTIIGSVFFMLGFWLSNYNVFGRLSVGKNALLGLMLLITCFMLTRIYCDGIRAQGHAAVAYTMIAIVGVMGVFYLCHALPKVAPKVGAALDRLGRITFYVLVFHFVAFKGVSYIILTIHSMPLERLSEFPVLKDVYPWAWVIYTIAGVLVSVGLYRCKNVVKSGLKAASRKLYSFVGSPE